MKWFLTEAQLSQLRLDAIHQVEAAYAAQLSTVGARADAELARVADASAPFVEHLRAEVEYWRIQYAYERQRADVSIDQRLAERGLGAVTLPTRSVAPEPPRPSPFADPELAAMGDPIGL